jgi:hypothetical protein
MLDKSLPILQAPSYIDKRNRIDPFVEGASMRSISFILCRRHSAKMLVVSALLLPAIISVGNSHGVAGAACTSPAYTTGDPNGGWSNGGYYVHNNMWNSSKYPVAETLYACSYNNWYVRAKMNNNSGDGAVKTYPNVHKDYTKVPISTFTYLTSTFAETAPHGSGIIYDVAYDIWTNGSTGTASAGSTEFMIWTENYNQVPSGTKQTTVTLGGRSYDVWKPSNSNSYIAFVPSAVFTSGTVDLLEIFKWTMNQGWIPSTSWLDQIDFGVEFVSTNNNTVTFTCTDFSINTTKPNGVIKETGFSGQTKSPIVKNEYYSPSGKRLQLKNGASDTMKHQITINRMTDAKGVEYCAVMVTR